MTAASVWPDPTDRYPGPNIANFADAEPWSEPARLAADRDLPAFPVKAFPRWLEEYVTALAVEKQTPVDLPAMVALGCLACVAGGRARVQVRPGWQEPLNLYLAPAMPPGSRKSPVFAAATEPIIRFEKDETERLAAIVRQELTERKIADRAAEQAEAAAGKAPDDQREALTAEAIAAAEHAAAIHVQVLPQFLVDDVTPEALAGLLADHGHIALFSAEGGVFDMMGGRYSNSGPNLEVYLKGHAGDMLRVNRKGRPTEYAERPALTITVTVQPEVLRALREHAWAKGRGVLARFLYSLPEDTVGHRQIAAPPVPPEVADRYRIELQTLARSLMQEVEAARLGSGEDLILTFSSEADHLMQEVEAELEPQLATHGRLGHARDWGAKLPGAIARIAGLLHLAETLKTGWGAPISASIVDAAVAVGRYLTEHALAVFDLIGADPLLEDARYVVGYLRQHPDLRQVSRRDLYTGLSKARFPTVDRLDPILEVLEDHEYIRRVEQPKPAGRGRPPGPVFEVNPHLCDPGSRPRNPA